MPKLLTQRPVLKSLFPEGSPVSPCGHPTAWSRWPTYVWWSPKAKGWKRAGYPGHPLFCADIISALRAAKTHANTETT